MPEKIKDIVKKIKEEGKIIPTKSAESNINYQESINSTLPYLDIEPIEKEQIEVSKEKSDSPIKKIMWQKQLYASLRKKELPNKKTGNYRNYYSKFPIEDKKGNELKSLKGMK